ncbi:MAG: AbrB/MazE/SpoVT family DNA-binding domain-containing protein [Proteobacteria bacterium]|nr:AbrB/MazE/SpoVT family DNA-binding domain-containing protein [Pseudomonadota bacterium]
MKVILSKWGNSLAVRIPAGLVRELSLKDGAALECAKTPTGTLELIPATKKARGTWFRNHFARVNERIIEQPMTTPAAKLLREEERY